VTCSPSPTPWHGGRGLFNLEMWGSAASTRRCGSCRKTWSG
jgi:hypothetical protein